MKTTILSKVIITTDSSGLSKRQLEEVTEAEILLGTEHRLNELGLLGVNVNTSDGKPHDVSLRFHFWDPGLENEINGLLKDLKQYLEKVDCPGCPELVSRINAQIDTAIEIKPNQFPKITDKVKILKLGADGQRK